jgi:hypothetical protein
MKKLSVMVPILSLLVTLAVFSFVALASQQQTASVTRLKGNARVKYGKGEFTKLLKGSQLKVGALIKTGRKSRIEIKLADRSVIRLGSKSSLTLQQAHFSGADSKNVAARLWRGKAYAVVSKLVGRKSSFEIKTSTAVAGVRGTAFRINAARDQSTVVRVYTGAVAVSNAPIYTKPAKDTKTAGKPIKMPRIGIKPGGPGRVEVAGPQQVSKKQWEEFIAQALQEVRVSAKGEVSAPVSFDAKTEEQEDEWVAWNKNLDKDLGH